MADFIIYFFELCNTTKLYHWNTTSFARHKASDELFESIISLSDTFMETFIGKYGRPKNIDRKINIKTLSDKVFIEYLKSSIKYLQSKLSPELKPDDTDLLNIRDELLGKMNQTLYLMTLS